MSGIRNVSCSVAGLARRLLRRRAITPTAAVLLALVGVISLGWNLASGQNCFSTDAGCSYGGSLVPCSNTVFCYTAPQGFVCANGAAIVSYQNSNPPNSWTNCATYQNFGACSDALTPCGTGVFFTAPRCGQNFLCQSNDTLNWCKGPAADAGCAPPQ